MVWPFSKRRVRSDRLDKPLLWYTKHDFLSRRTLLESVVVQGRSGSGKTSGPGRALQKSIFSQPDIGGCLLTSKPEERGDVEKLFKQLGQSHRLRIFAPDQPWRFNILNWEMRAGADARELSNILMTISETLDRNKGGGNQRDPFFAQAAERKAELAIIPLLLATHRVNARELQRFVTGAAMSQQELASEPWKAGFHNQVLLAAGKASKTPLEQAAWEQAREFWGVENVFLDNRTRSSIDAQLQNTLHVFASGIVGDLLSNNTNITPAFMDEGGWIVVDASPSRWGSVGQFVNGAIKIATQRHILRRHATSKSALICLWSDEVQNHINLLDAKWLAETRSHLGFGIFLTQSLHAFYASLNQSGDHSEADALLTNFGTKIACALGDPKSAEYHSKLCGKSLQTFFGGSTSTDETVFDQVFGQTKFSANFSQKWEANVTEAEFMHRLRTGGKPDCMVDAWIIKSGKPFRASGTNWIRTSFSQR